MTNKQKLLSTAVAAGLALTGCRQAAPPKAVPLQSETKVTPQIAPPMAPTVRVDPSITADRGAGVITYDNGLSRLGCKFGIITVIPGASSDGIAAVPVVASTSNAIESARKMCKSYDITPGF